MKIQASQIEKIQSTYIRVGGLSATGASTNATSALTTAVSTAGNSGVAVPLQVSASVAGVGVVTAAPLNRVEIYDATTKGKILNSSFEVYGRLTEAAGVYVLTYFYLAANGTETAHSFGSATSIDFEFIYRFDLHRLPADAIVALTGRNVILDAGGTSGARQVTEQLTVTALNTLAALTFTPNTTANICLNVNGHDNYTFGGANAPFTISSKTITWNPAANAGAYDIQTGWMVVVRYTTLE